MPGVAGAGVCVDCGAESGIVVGVWWNVMEFAVVEAVFVDWLPVKFLGNWCL